MDSVVINGKNYFSEDHIKAKSVDMARDCVLMAVNSIETALKDLRQMMALPQQESMSLEKVIAAAVSPNAMSPMELLNRVVSEVRREDVPTAALIQGATVVTTCYRHGIFYLHIPSFMEPLFLHDAQQCEKRHRVVTTAVRSVLQDDVTVLFVTSSLKGFNGELRKVADEIALVLSSQAETLWAMTPTQRTVYVGWKLIDAEVKSGVRTVYEYADVRKASGMTHSTTYHAMQKLKENGYINFDNLVGKGIKNNEA